MGIIDKSMLNYKTMREFRFWVQKVLPLVYDDSLSYYELLSKVVRYLNTLNDNVELLKELILMFEGEGYLVVLTAFGAKGDGVTDDTEAYEKFIKYDAGIKYIPSGKYLVNGNIMEFEYGCFGNGAEIEMPSYTYRDLVFNYGEYAFWRDGNGSLNKNYDEFTDKNDFKPVNQTTFIQNTDGNFSYNDYNAGVVGYEVKGGIKGSSNGMPIGFRSVMFSENAGDGDVVGVWSRVYKHDGEQGVNNSDACAGHFSAICDDTGSGITMANEIWAYNKKNQGQRGTNFSYFFEPGGIVGSQYIARSNEGMAQSHILIGGATDAKYGAWNVMTIRNTGFKYNDRTNYPANTSVFKMADFTIDACPNIVNWYGFAPYHVKINGGYRYNIGADSTTIINSTLNGEPSLAVIRQANSDTTETDKTATIALGHQTFGGETHAPNINTERSIAWRVYHSVGNNNIFYRAEAGDDNVDRRNHAFYCWDGSNEVSSAIITSSGIIPGRNIEENLGSKTLKWSNLYCDRINIDDSWGRNTFGDFSVDQSTIVPHYYNISSNNSANLAVHRGTIIICNSGNTSSTYYITKTFNIVPITNADSNITFGDVSNNNSLVTNNHSSSLDITTIHPGSILEI